jgi:hypothetical protein
MRIGWICSAAGALLLCLGSTSQAQVSIGIQIGQPPPPREYVVAPPPGPEFVWVEGYWYPQGKHYRWHDGYWTRPPYQGASWVEPYYDRGTYFAGYWDGPSGRFDHDHRWDRDRDRRDDRYEEWRDQHRDHGRRDRQ